MRSAVCGCFETEIRREFFQKGDEEFTIICRIDFRKLWPGTGLEGWHCIDVSLQHVHERCCLGKSINSRMQLACLDGASGLVGRALCGEALAVFRGRIGGVDILPICPLQHEARGMACRSPQRCCCRSHQASTARIFGSCLLSPESQSSTTLHLIQSPPHLRPPNIESPEVERLRLREPISEIALTSFSGNRVKIVGRASCL